MANVLEFETLEDRYKREHKISLKTIRGLLCVFKGAMKSGDFATAESYLDRAVFVFKDLEVLTKIYKDSVAKQEATKTMKWENKITPKQIWKMGA